MKVSMTLFHGPVILHYILKSFKMGVLPYILKSISCINIILPDYESVYPEG